jgi:hypothetical protein
MLGKPPPPVSEKASPYAPPAPQGPLVFEQWQGVNTNTDRAGVPDQQAYWIDGFFPLAPRKLRAMPGIGSAIYTAPGILTIVYYEFYNLGSVTVPTVEYAAVLLSDGSVVQVNVATLAVTTILSAGTIQNATVGQLQFNQYGQQYLIIVANQTNGYWLWDGTNVYAAGTLSPTVVLTDTGSAYKTAPSVTASGGFGSGATFVATIGGGLVTNVTVVSPGSGYQAGDIVTLTFTGGNSAGSGATFTANMNDLVGSGASFTANMQLIGAVGHGINSYTIASVTINAGGSNYSQFTTLSISGSGFTVHSQPTLAPVIVGGVITNVIVVGGGVFYDTVTPNVLVLATDAGQWYISSVTVNATGSGYSGSTVLTVAGGDSPIAQATLTPVIVAGAITSVNVTNGGIYRGPSPAPSIAAVDSVTNAAATVQLMPFGVQGTTVDTYSGHVWVVNGPLIQWTAPGSVSDFATSDGGGALTSNSSVLKAGYTKVISDNGFLYLVGDSSVDYISGVQTAGSPPTTTFTLQNADPETGTPFAATVIAVGQGIAFANSWGAQELLGSSAQKTSEMLDGVYGTGFNAFGNLLNTSVQPSMAKAIVFDKKVTVLLLTIIDPVSQATQNKLLIRHGNIWFASLQDVTITMVRTQEINSNFVCYGTDGTHIYPLFNTPSTAFQKTVRSKFWDAPGGIEYVKTSVNLWGLLNVGSTTDATFTVNVDSAGSASNTYTYTPAATGHYNIPPTAVGQQGVLTGLTIQTNAADITLVAFKMLDEIVQYLA